MKTSEYMRKKRERKLRSRAPKPGLKQRISALAIELRKGNIPFRYSDLRKIGVKRWSGYHSYLLTVARAA